MLDFFKMKGTPLVGVDIGTSSIKLLEIRQQSDIYEITRCALSERSTDYVHDQSITNELRKALHAVVMNSKTDCRYAAIAVGGPSVITRQMQVGSNLNPEEILDYIQLNFDQVLPFPLEESYYDFEIMGPSKEDATLNDILFAAAHIEVVQPSRRATSSWFKSNSC